MQQEEGGQNIPTTKKISPIPKGNYRITSKELYTTKTIENDDF